MAQLDVDAMHVIQLAVPSFKDASASRLEPSTCVIGMGIVNK